MNEGIFQGEYGEATEHLATYNFPVELKDISAAGGIAIPDKSAVVRTDTNQVLGVVGSNYKLLPHKNAIDPLLHELDRRNIKTFKRITTTANGARLYANIYFPDKKASFGKGEDPYYPGITVVNSLDGVLRYTLEATIYRLACTNGMMVPTAVAGGRATHSKNKDFNSIMDSLLDFVSDDKKFEVFQRWATQVLSVEEMGQLAETMFKVKGFNFPKRYLPEVNEYIAKEASFGVVSVWGLYNSFQSVIEHVLVRDKGKYDRGIQLEENLYKSFAKKFKV